MAENVTIPVSAPAPSTPEGRLDALFAEAQGFDGDIGDAEGGNLDEEHPGFSDLTGTSDEVAEDEPAPEEKPSTSNSKAVQAAAKAAQVARAQAQEATAKVQMYEAVLVPLLERLAPALEAMLAAQQGGVSTPQAKQTDDDYESFQDPLEARLAAIERAEQARAQRSQAAEKAAVQAEVAKLEVEWTEAVSMYPLAEEFSDRVLDLAHKSNLSLVDAAKQIHERIASKLGVSPAAKQPATNTRVAAPQTRTAFRPPVTQTPKPSGKGDTKPAKDSWSVARDSAAARLAALGPLLD